MYKRDLFRCETQGVLLYKKVENISRQPPL